MAGGSVSSDTKVVQITNIAPQATKDQMQSLFGNIGKIEEIRLYPTVRDVSCPVQSRICYVKYVDSTCVPVAQHLTNTVFIDRALIIIPVLTIPDEYRALEMSKNGTIVPGLHKPDSKLPSEVINRLEGMPPNQVIRTYDPKLEQNFLPPYPPLPSHFDSRKIEEIRRTVIVWDANSEFRLDDLMDLFAKAGEVKYACWAEKDNKLFAMIEFCEQKSVIAALKLQGTEFKGALLNVYHSTEAILKPEAKSNEAAQREIEEAMSIVKEAQNMISAAIDPVIGMLAKDKRRRSRSRSRERRRSRSRSGRRSRSRRRSKSGTRGKRSRSKSKRRSVSHGRRSSSRKRSPSRSKRSRSRSKRRSRSHSKKSHSRERRRRSHSRRRSASRSSRTRRSRSRAKKSRSVDRKRSFRKDEKSRNSRSRSKSRSKRSTSRSRSTRNKDSKSSKKRSRSVEIKKLKRIPEESIVRDYDAEEKIGIFEENRKSPSFAKSDNMDISNSP